MINIKDNDNVQLCSFIVLKYIGLSYFFILNIFIIYLYIKKKKKEKFFFFFFSIYNELIT